MDRTLTCPRWYKLKVPVFTVISCTVHQVICAVWLCSSELIRHVTCHLQFLRGSDGFVLVSGALAMSHRLSCVRKKLIHRYFVHVPHCGIEDRGSIAHHRPACIYTLDAVGTLLQTTTPNPPKSEGLCFLIDASVHLWWALSIGHTTPGAQTASNLLAEFKWLPGKSKIQQ